MPGANGTPMRAHGHEEKPERQAPEPEPEPIGHDEGDLAGEEAVAGTHEVGGDDAGEALAHADYAGDGEARGADGDEHAGAEGLLGEFLGHEAVDEGCVAVGGCKSIVVQCFGGSFGGSHHE